MDGKVCVVTGASSGIGFETALSLAKNGAKVLMIARNEQRVMEAVDKVIRETQNKQINGAVIDLSSQRDIRRGASDILSRIKVIDILINNAGTWNSKLRFTEENIEMQFAVNFLASFLLTYLLLPALSKSNDPRIINMGSDTHFNGKIHFNDINLTSKYHGLRAYAQSKLANLLFTYEFERRKPLDKLCINTMHPGVVKTNIGFKHSVALHGLAWKIRGITGLSPAKGSDTLVYLASSNDIQGISGKYWEKRMPVKSSKRSYIKEDAQRLWLLSEKLCDIDEYFSAVDRLD